MTHDDLVYKIASRVKELADQKMPILRIWADVKGKNAQAEMANIHSSRGELIEEIICHEFLEES